MKNEKAFFDYAKERYRILLRRQAGRPKPWTEDATLRKYRFCNVFREDDTVTQWIRKHLTLRTCGDQLFGAMVIARWFNRVETLEHMLPPQNMKPAAADNLFTCWGDGNLSMWADTMSEALKGRKPLVTGAYMIKTPAGKTKLEGLIWCLLHVLEDAEHLQARIEPGETTLEGVTEVLAGYPYLGNFMAYEVVTDLRHSLLSEAPDILTWASPGPGAARGLARVEGLPKETYRYSQKEDRETLIAGMRCLLQASTNQENWPSEWPAWEMREVEHTLCEFDKYERVRTGEGKPKQLYRGE